ncbi:hypothetical protein BKA70DRAFT_1493625 [Coprinopsis sp. MPI-PUGE-AT-0042]|nr:hypothetical protein BKA70DRAFT_1493625 [Coprinopsis sp. MPI-PUGE-AT-0042]
MIMDRAKPQPLRVRIPFTGWQSSETIMITQEKVASLLQLTSHVGELSTSSIDFANYTALHFPSLQHLIIHDHVLSDHVAVLNAPKLASLSLLGPVLGGSDGFLNLGLDWLALKELSVSWKNIWVQEPVTTYRMLIRALSQMKNLEHLNIEGHVGSGHEDDNLRTITVRAELKEPSSSGSLLIEISHTAFKTTYAATKHLDDPLKHMVLAYGTFLKVADTNRAGLVTAGASTRKHVKVSHLPTEWTEATHPLCSPPGESKFVNIDTTDFKPLLTSLAGVSGDWVLFIEVGIGP